MKLYIQDVPTTGSYNGSLAANASTMACSSLCNGYARLVGGVIGTASLSSGCGLKVSQSFDAGTNWDYQTLYAVGACSASTFSIELAGNAVRVDIFNGATSNASIRSWWGLRPV